MRVLLLLVAVLVAGCAKEAPKPVEAARPATPEQGLYEQLRAGAFQLGSAGDSLAEAIDRAAELAKRPETKDAAQEIQGLLDSAGSGIAEYSEPPEKAGVEADFARWDEQRLQAIEAANDARHEVREAVGILESLDDSAEPMARECLTRLETAAESLESAIESLGGKVEAHDEAPAE